jgi:hypothetical protein
MEWYKINNASNRNSFSKNKTAYYKPIDKVPINSKQQQIIYDKLEIPKKGAISPPKILSKKGVITYNEICNIMNNN